MAFDGHAYTGDTTERPASGKTAKARKAEVTPFDLGPDKSKEQYVPHIGCITLSGQLTDSEQDYIGRWVGHMAGNYPSVLKVSDRTATTTTIRIAPAGAPSSMALGICMTNDGKKVMVCEPVRSRPFGKAPTKVVVDALHDWRHKHGSEESNKIVRTMKRIVSRVSGSRSTRTRSKVAA